MTSVIPPVEREYIEIYPVKWSPLGPGDIAQILSTRSYEDIREITLYLHIPFCPEVCAFCGFNKMLYRETVYTEYIAALANEIQYYQGHPDLDGRIVTAVYFGGGTASTLTPSDLEYLMQKLKEVFPIAHDCEFTVESHPNTLDYDKLRRYADAGINRLSIGVQSFSDRKLQAIGRHNTAAQNERVIREAQAAGIHKLSLDLMYRLPYETIEELESDLAKICEFQPTNLSCYSLIVEGTGLERALPALPEMRVETEMFALIQETLTRHGYTQWSIADFCQPGGITRYNLNYWRAPQTLLLGMGAGAHSHYFGGHTWTNIYSISGYLEAIKRNCFAGIIGQAVSTEELMCRYMVLGVHCLSVDKAPFKKLFGADIGDVFAWELSEMADYGWIRETDRQIQVTTDGHLYLNNIAQGFFSQACRGEVQPWSKGLQRLRQVEYVPVRSKNHS